MFLFSFWLWHQVPESWLWSPSGADLSWVVTSLGPWFTTLQDRDAQIRMWMSGPRPLSFWLPGFFNPWGFLTAMKQEVARVHKKEDWALDDVVYTTEVRKAPSERCRCVVVQISVLDATRWWVCSMQRGDGCAQCCRMVGIYKAGA